MAIYIEITVMILVLLLSFKFKKVVRVTPYLEAIYLATKFLLPMDYG